jgi:uncharacterized protein DUF4350
MPRLEGPFRRSVLVWLVAVGACSLALTVAFVIARPETRLDSSGADAYSRSALGHRAFLELLRASGVPVVISRHASGARAGATAVLVVAEPRFDAEDPARQRRLEDMLEPVKVALLVLPKWSGRASPLSPDWIAAAEPVPGPVVGRTLQAAHVPATLARPGGQGPETCEGTAVPVTWSEPQLLVPLSSDLRPLISCPGGILLGEMMLRRKTRLVVLSDPDLLANHGLGQGENARLALEVLGHARRASEAVVVDETLHGHEHVPSLWKELFVFPLLPSVLQGGLALLAFVWSGLGRFGAPLPAPAPLASGKNVLVENTASLLQTAGHSAHTLGRYFDATVTEVARALHAPPTTRDLHAWLDGLGRRRGVRVDLAVLAGQVERARGPEAASASTIVTAARRIHRWKREMLRGPQDDPGR